MYPNQSITSKQKQTVKVLLKKYFVFTVVKYMKSMCNHETRKQPNVQEYNLCYSRFSASFLILSRSSAKEGRPSGLYTTGEEKQRN